MRAIAIRNTAYKKEPSHSLVTLCPIIKSKRPAIGQVFQLEMLYKKEPVKVLLDTGSPTSFIKRNVAQRLQLKLFDAPPFHFKGIVSKEAAVSSKAVQLKLEYKNIKIDAPVYVTDHIPYDIILGHPLITTNEQVALLLQNNNNKKKNVNKTKKEDYPVYDVNIVNMDTDEVLDEPSVNMKNALVINVVDGNVAESWNKLPPWLQKKFAGTVRNDLPQKDESKNDSVVHEIDIKPDGKLPRSQPYNTTFKSEEIISNIVDDLIKKKFIVPSKSPCSSPVVLVPKKDGSYRLCVDYRALNKVTVKDPFPLPRIERLLARIGNAKIFTTLDLHSGYHQIPMKKDDTFKTAFVTPTGKYEYTVMPFGLVNAPSTFARYMSDLFRSLPFVCVYLDDILIYSDNEEEHWKHIDTVLSTLRNEGLIAKKKKCFFAQKSVEFLGYSVAHNKLQPLITKCAAISKFPVPTTVKQAQRFLGMVNYYRRFLRNCSDIEKPIQNFISKGEKWSVEQDKAFESLKNSLMKNPVLVPFKQDGSYRLTTDASKIGVGAVLEEVDSSGKLLGVVGYFSKSLQGAQKNYPAGELELLGIIAALQHFRYLLHGKRFTLRTDHISLLSLKNNTEPSRRVQKWLELLGTYDCELEYLAGPKNLVADAISRAEYTVGAIMEDVPIDPRSWYDEYKSDPLCAALLVYFNELQESDIDIASGDKSAYNKYAKKLKLSNVYKNHFDYTDGILRYDGRIVVPLSRISEIMSLYHDNQLYGGHFGLTATFGKIAPLFYWSKQQHSINEFIRSCTQCQVSKVYRPRNQGLTHPLPVPEGRWLDISIDFASGLPETFSGNNLIMVVVDRFSKRSHFIAAKYPLTSYETINLLFRYVFAYHGFPRTITSDRDTRFTSKIYQEFAKRLGIKLTMSSSNHPQTDGQSERTIQILNRLLKTYVANNHKHWDTFLPMMEYAYNSTPNRTTKLSPFETDLGYIPNKPSITTENELNARHFATVDFVKHQNAILLQVKDLLNESATNMETTNNSTRQDISFEVGENVLLHRDAYFTGGKYSKVQPIYLGPFRIVKKVHENAYELDLPSSTKKHRIINIQFLKKLHLRKDRYPKDPPNTSIERINRASEVTAVKGFDRDNQVYYCRMLDVDPSITVEYTPHEFSQIPAWIRKSLVANFNQLLVEQTQDKEEEDVVFDSEVGDVENN